MPSRRHCAQQPRPDTFDSANDSPSCELCHHKLTWSCWRSRGGFYRPAGVDCFTPPRPL